MRPETAHQRISKVLWNDFLVRQGLRKKTLVEIQAELLKIEPELQKLYTIAMIEDPDPRNGLETYGYKDFENIKDSLAHISDRWNSSFRIRWLLDLITLDVTLLSEVLENKEFQEELL